MKETPENFIAAKMNEFDALDMSGIGLLMRNNGDSLLAKSSILNMKNFLRSALQGLLSELKEKIEQMDQDYGCYHTEKILKLFSHYQQSTKDEPQ